MLFVSLVICFIRQLISHFLHYSKDIAIQRCRLTGESLNKVVLSSPSVVASVFSYRHFYRNISYSVDNDCFVKGHKKYKIHWNGVTCFMSKTIVTFVFLDVICFFCSYYFCNIVQNSCLVRKYYKQTDIGDWFGVQQNLFVNLILNLRTLEFSSFI